MKNNTQNMVGKLVEDTFYKKKTKLRIYLDQQSEMCFNCMFKRRLV